MELSKQVCSLDLAKRLKELGVKQESYFWWKEVVDDYDDVPKLLGPFKAAPDDRSGSYGNKEGRWEEHFYSAFTVAELGEMLPNYTISARMDPEYSERHGGDWSCSNEQGDLRGTPHCYANTEADARAKMLVYLLENKLITI